MDSKYDIRFANIDDLDLIKKFINEHWKVNHVMATSQQLIDFMHLNGCKYNFLIAVNKERNEIDALQGFIPTSQYDSELLLNGDSWGAIAKRRSDIKNDEIGSIYLKTLSLLLLDENYHSFGAISISQDAYNVLSPLHFQTGYLSHYYILNPDIIDFNIAVVPSNVLKKESFGFDSEYKLKHIDIETLQDAPTNLYRPLKSKVFFINRYFKHPFYHYHFLGIYNSDNVLTSIWVYRKIEVRNSSCLRIVDVLGKFDEIDRLKEQFIEILREENAEYIDVLNYGIPSYIFHKIGFEELNYDSNEVIIPEYFEPFLRENKKIIIAYDSDYDDYVVFKGDGDQDRPNMI